MLKCRVSLEIDVSGGVLNAFREMFDTALAQGGFCAAVVCCAVQRWDLGER